ncbi:hypothetical protein AVEN_269577-1 [Araneus ventricosus]|uniref:Uncharacterized protein n=1 Tax=Araneus ventricosus TaxID=182803 RepID=A0A4Y2CE01_ARAVE|nr:hypothetical protein AVEN_269577-1 [Araneus ventricosus]
MWLKHDLTVCPISSSAPSNVRSPWPSSNVGVGHASRTLRAAVEKNGRSPLVIMAVFLFEHAELLAENWPFIYYFCFLSASSPVSSLSSSTSPQSNRVLMHGPGIQPSVSHQPVLVLLDGKRKGLGRRKKRRERSCVMLLFFLFSSVK